MDLKPFHPHEHMYTRYLFFTGKGGVGKTSSASALALTLANQGKQVLLVSTDPASNLDDVLDVPLTNYVASIPDVPGLYASNIDPRAAAEAYKETVVGPYRGTLPATAVAQMEEQLSGACTVEIAAFNTFAEFITASHEAYDHIIFDTAPTGHTLRLLQLPAAWDTFLESSTHGASCLGPLSGLSNQKTMYETAVQRLSDPALTTVFLIARPDRSSLQEALQTSEELYRLDLTQQRFLINGVFTAQDTTDPTAVSLEAQQQSALQEIKEVLSRHSFWTIPYHASSFTGIEALSHFFHHVPSETTREEENSTSDVNLSFESLLQDIEHHQYRLVFTMGKGGVGKTTIATAIAYQLAERGHPVHLTTTDPANHLSMMRSSDPLPTLTISSIDPQEALVRYQEKMKTEAVQAGASDAELAYLDEDLSSPCTEEIAVFQDFANVVARADQEIVIIDTAPTGHTLLLLQHAEQYTKELQRSRGSGSKTMEQLLPRLRNPKETAFLLLTLPEATPVLEAERLQNDLVRSGITPTWWVINQSFAATGTRDPLLQRKGQLEQPWLDYVHHHLASRAFVLPWETADTLHVFNNDSIMEGYHGNHQ